MGKLHLVILALILALGAASLSALAPSYELAGSDALSRIGAGIYEECQPAASCNEQQETDCPPTGGGQCQTTLPCVANCGNTNPSEVCGGWAYKACGTSVGSTCGNGDNGKCTQGQDDCPCVPIPMTGHDPCHGTQYTCGDAPL